MGRGGTDFQEVIDYYKEHKEYDGLIIFTDGYAPIPKIPPNRKILWVHTTGKKSLQESVRRKNHDSQVSSLENQ